MMFSLNYSPPLLHPLQLLGVGRFLFFFSPQILPLVLTSITQSAALRSSFPTPTLRLLQFLFLQALPLFPPGFLPFVLPFNYLIGRASSNLPQFPYSDAITLSCFSSSTSFPLSPSSLPPPSPPPPPPRRLFLDLPSIKCILASRSLD